MLLNQEKPKRRIPRSMIPLLDEYKMLEGGKRILDIGCKDGRFFVEVMRREIIYYGFDVNLNAVNAARLKFPPNFTFAHADLQNDTYNPEGKLDAGKYQFPFRGPFDTVICSSLFTHVPRKVTFNYIGQIFESLEDEGLAYMTFFRSPPNEVTSDTARTVYEESFIMNMLSSFDILHTEGGLTDGRHDQWKLIIRK